METPFSLKGKVSLITGASRGLGRAMAMGLAKAGSNLMLVDRHYDQLEDAVEAISQQTGRYVSSFHADLQEIVKVAEIPTACADIFGRLDILVNNAATTVRKPFFEITPEEFDRVVAVNTKAAFFLSQQSAQVMVKQEHSGKIVNMASLTSVIGMHNLSAYGVSKGGIYALTKGLAVELAPYGICVNAIAPGFFATDLTLPVWQEKTKRDWVQSRIPFERPGTPEDVTGTVVFLCSPASDYLTGQIIFLDGGWMAA